MHDKADAFVPTPCLLPRQLGVITDLSFTLLQAHTRNVKAHKNSTRVPNERQAFTRPTAGVRVFYLSVRQNPLNATKIIAVSYGGFQPKKTLSTN